MENISPEALELLRDGAPEFVLTVDRAVERGRSRIAVSLDAFLDDPMLLYAAVWYGLARGLTLAFTPRD